MTEIKSRFACKLLFKAMETMTPASQYILSVTILVCNLEYVLSTCQCTVLIKWKEEEVLL